MALGGWGGGARIVVICSLKLPPDLFGTGSSVLRNACFVPNLQLRSASHQHICTAVLCQRLGLSTVKVRPKFTLSQDGVSFRKETLFFVQRGPM